MTNIRKTISRTMTVVSGTATFVTLYSWYQSVQESQYVRSKFNQLLLENKELQKQITDLQSLETNNQNKIMESILAKYDSQLELSSNRILQKIELIKKLNEDQQKSSGLEQINSQSEAVTNEVRSLSNVLNNILSEIHKKKFR
jgi:predicted nuclease with TOPRIM domain